MRTIITQITIILMFTGIAFSDDPTISWVSGENPPALSRLPQNPTINDVITLTIPTDVFKNHQRAEEILGGKPTLTIDYAQQRIDIKVVPPGPTNSPETYDPVSGLECHFGPLDEGWWTLFVQFPGTIYIDPFQVVFAPPSPVISGNVHTSDSVGIDNVILIFSNGGGIAFTNNNGDYTQQVPSGWSGTATPLKEGFIFQPSGRSYSNVEANIPNQDYKGIDVSQPFTEQFVPGEDVFDLANKSILFVPTLDGKSYTGQIKEISQLPVDPTGGVNLDLGDDDSKLVKLTSPKTVSIFGNSFTSFYVGSNGYITFTEGDEEFAASLENHFAMLRVSGLFRDLNPTAGGSVSRINTPDGVAVTWLKVPEFGKTNSNTFQIELLFDGSIRLSWLVINAEGGIVGLSDGEGLQPDFVETDLSELLVIPPPPPPVDDDLTEEFLSPDVFDLEYASITFTPTADGNSYTGILENITQLPTNPAGSTDLGLGDDNAVQVLLSHQRKVKIFGQSFQTFFVGSNGYVTFTQSDHDFSQTLEEHFEMLRISGLYTDLNAANEGIVTGKQLIDRVAITWQAVPEASNTSPNTFQIELFWDGTIRLSWLEIGSDENIVGLSNGLGLPVDFEESDFSIKYAMP